MPRHRLVPTLEQLSLSATGQLVVALVPQILTQLAHSRHHQPQATLQLGLDSIRDTLLRHVPLYLYDTMAVEVLHAVKSLIEKTKKCYYPHVSITAFMTEMNVVVSLTETVLSRHLRHIDFSLWPKIMRYVLYKNLYRLSGLEVLNLGSCTGGWRTESYDKSIVLGIANMRNLRSLCLCFDCSDYVIKILAKNCEQLQVLDVTSSRSVTDRSIPSILHCKQLRELQLLRTSITVEGLAELLMGLDKLQDIGRCDDFGSVLQCIKLNSIQSTSSRTFNLRKVHTRNLSTENLQLLVELCPKIETISLFRDELFSDLTVLTGLENLCDLKLLSCDFYTNYMRQLLEIRGCNLTSLHLEHVEEIDMNAIVYVSQSCPFLKNLVVYNCDFLDQSAVYNRVFLQRPFQHLERVFWVVDCALSHLEFVLAYCVNIRFIHLGSSTGITHESVAKLLAVNPMRRLEELRILYSSNMSIETVQLLLGSCPVLRVMSELESWQGISREELAKFRVDISAGNCDLDIRPTLSY